MRKNVLTIGAILAATLLLPGAAAALGLGANVTYSYRTGTWAGEDVNLGGNSTYEDMDFSSNDLGFGFTLDTAVAKDKLYNYRLNINYQHSWFDVSLPEPPTALTEIKEFEYDGFEIENIFGFAVMRREDLRWWVGPSIRISAGRALLRGNGGSLVQNVPQLDAGAGLVTGVNLHRGKHLSVGGTFGYHINWSLLEYQEPIEIQYTGATHRVSLGLTVLYRFKGDTFRVEEPVARRR